MERSVIRLRKEYLFQRQREKNLASIEESKKKLRYSIQNLTEMPGDIKKQAKQLKNSIELEDERTRLLKTSEDNEYALAGFEDPHVLLTTTHDPSQRLSQFLKELKLVFPESTRMNRGKLSIAEMMELARKHNFSDVIILGETRGQPDSLLVTHLPFGPTLRTTLFNVVMRHEVEKMPAMSQQYPHLIFDSFSSALGERVSSILKHLFPVPKEDSKRVITFSNSDDFISFRNHSFSSDKQGVSLDELGPRFDLRPFEIKQGTAEMKGAETEWSLAPYTNTAKKQKKM
ncbi:U3 small nuclear ribonucleoprotein (snRNP) [Perkinsela sp. CCAP 1560/4]|nr:U3 small nuclear ribonucleoprotein (snRNP) [Perkinsela sp. CCAP 1560/4]|eukprot:KNH06407.1 U3 small nuclear ribonucleoprotein (snRNP) [Perkinsela sp. CCAP 1560/4]